MATDDQQSSDPPKVWVRTGANLQPDQPPVIDEPVADPWGMDYHGNPTSTPDGMVEHDYN